MPPDRVGGKTSTSFPATPAHPRRCSNDVYPYFKLIVLMPLALTQKFCAALIGIAICFSCSRPVAYFQPEASSSLARPETQPMVMTTPVQATVAPIKAQMQVEPVPLPMEARVPKEGERAPTAKLNEPMTWVTYLSSPQPLNPTTASPLHKATLANRLMLKRINKKSGRYLAPSKPEKTMVANRARLIGGLVLLIAGVLLILSGNGRQLNGTVGFIGIFVVLFGIVGVILGFFGD